jgi:hypothetical protein
MNELNPEVQEIATKIKPTLDALEHVGYDYSDFDANELYALSNRLGTKDIPKIMRYMMYMDLTSSGMPRTKAFRKIFPERSVATEKGLEQAKNGMFAAKENGEKRKVGEPLPDATIMVKAKRLENSILYKGIFALLSNSLYISYAFDRMKVLNRALSKSLSDDVADRDQVQYMKVFLDETRKAQESKAMEINLNVNTGDTNIAVFEQKLADISSKLKGLDASTVIDVLATKKED